MTNNIVNCVDILKKEIQNEKLYNLIYTHSRNVADLAIEIANNPTTICQYLSLDLRFIEEAALLHDIGIGYVHNPDIGAHGDAPYMEHQKIGYDLLCGYDLPKHANVALTHGGLGFSKEQIEQENRGFTAMDMIPVSWEEKIISFADCFFGKYANSKLTIEQIKKKFVFFEDCGKIPLFDHYCALFFSPL